MKYIAIIGYGVVGGGITAVLDANREVIEKAVGDRVDVKYILDLRDFPDSPYGDRVVHEITPILEDQEVALVCETMGGSHPAYEFSVSCMKAGKSVVTSNKEVVAAFGDQLLRCAAENGVSYLFEASVGGGIPVLRSFATSLAGERISQISGIVNGTTNYILTKMAKEGRDFDDVLKEAQLLGFAEANPSADIDGIDAQRKIIILSALTSGILASAEEVKAHTLRHITSADMNAAAALGGEIKLIAQSKIGEELEAYVCPMIVPHSDPLSGVCDVYNAICVTSPVTGDVMYYGRGAGRYPTAGAVMGDVVAVLSGAAKAEKIPVFEKKVGAVKPFDKIPFTYYIRAEGSRSGILEKLSALCDQVKILSDRDGVVEAVAGEMTQAELDKVSEGLLIHSVIRIKKN